MAFSAVVLPAPLGPMNPRIRPSSTRRSMPPRATVAPKALRRPRASMHAMASVLLLGGIGLGCFRRFGGSAICAVQKFLCLQAEPLNSCRDSGHFIAQKFPTLPLQQQASRAGVDEHAAASPAFDQAFVHQLLIAL